MRQFIRHYLLSLQFFTRIPVTGKLADWVGFSPAMLRASAGHFPGVGVLVGGLVAGFAAGLMMLLPPTGSAPLVAAALSTAFGVWVTGAFHEDGLADVFDGLGGSAERDRALEIMKDSRVGAFGAIAIVLTLLCKVVLLALLGDVSGPLMVLVALWAAGRAAMLFQPGPVWLPGVIESAFLVAFAGIAGCSNLLPDGTDLRSKNANNGNILSVGQIAPEFSLSDSDGNTVTLSQALAGKTGVIIYFTMWCSICTAHSDEMLNSVMPAYGNVKFFLADYVSATPAEAGTMKNFSGYGSTAFTVLSDPAQQLMNSYGATMGFTVVIDSTKKIRLNESYKRERIIATLGAL